MHHRIFLIAVLASVVARGESLPVADSIATFEGRLRESVTFRGALPATGLTAASRTGLARIAPGAALFAATSFASVDEVVDVGRSRSYDQAAISAGVRVPLLGSRYRQLVELDDAALAQASAEATLELQRRELLAQLRQAYLQYWSASERRALADEYLVDRPALESVLLRRTGAGLLLESDRREFMAGFENVATDRARAEAELRSAAKILAMLTGSQPAARLASYVATPQACASFDVDAHPEVRVLTARATHLQQRAASPTWRPIQSELRVGYSRSAETATGAPGSSAFISMTFEYAFGTAATAARGDYLQRDSAAQALALRRQQLALEIERLRGSGAVLAQAVQLARQSREAAEAKLRERSLRAAKLAGDVIEQRQQARYAFYRARYAEHMAMRDQLDWHVAATAFEDSGCRTDPGRAGTIAAAGDADLARGLYVWSAAPLLAALDDPAAPIWQRLQALKVGRLLLSFTPEELAAWQSDPRRLGAAIEALHARGYSVEWLLGEPTWMLPARRAALLAHLDAFAGLPFDALHLDLEPNQLDAAGGDGREHLDNLLATLRAVRAATRKPVGLSIHPRYMTMQAGGAAFGEQLARLGVQPTLMVYVADADRVRAIAEPLRARWPGLPRRVAVSVEYELDNGHSVARLSAAALESHLAALEQKLRDAAFRGLVLQPSAQWLYATDATPGRP